jgi:hypothetical protein
VRFAVAPDDGTLGSKIALHSLAHHLRICFDPAGRISQKEGTSMYLRLGFAAAIMLASISPALADANSCSDPIAPTSVDGSHATEDQMKNDRDDVVQFIKDSDTFQDCINTSIRDMQTESAKDPKKHPLDKDAVQALLNRISANQKLKEKVGGEFNAAVQAYKANHHKS